ncbi:hypothetical protein IU500_13420 [Nocardia terpenica]|uniref:LppA family lipoprotein n=1 Tax=Nocardia terpenica TaxID=455432 RepID=UPI001895EEF5|nr:LppA family lipoprotein [Nocardia terpenica]MBF6062823.1 hypothetical protein [Nocardia terpenica]MBF6105042.1 hypothetical protein [Nocardia terpenica]MBF6112521.1 hypothetical protein [Nocardia terpenica]MBF6118770.1 hypothetical protein [Nocardia terpenica]MBF6154239.1 hypothetical protein [Nocardia terpenica]
MDDQQKPTGEKETAEAAQKLLQRPSLEEATAQMQSIVEQIAAVASDLIPGMKWEWVDERSRHDCPKPYDQTDGQAMSLPNYWARNTPIPDDQWPQFIARVRPIAATVGAIAPETMQDKPGAHDLWFYNNDDGTTIKIASDKATVISGRTGCRLPADRFNSPTRPTP